MRVLILLLIVVVLSGCDLFDPCGGDMVYDPETGKCFTTGPVLTGH